jgi:hypothetical protein
MQETGGGQGNDKEAGGGGGVGRVRDMETRNEFYVTSICLY